MMLLKNKVCLITGAAKGIGKSIAELFSGEGAKVIITYRSSEKEAAALQKKISCEIFKLDVTYDDQCFEVINKVYDKYKRIDVLINNASYSASNCYNLKVEDINISEWNKTNLTDINGTFYMTRAIVPIMKKQKSGSIINFTSSAALVGDETCILYSAAKSGIAYFTKAVAKQLAGSTIRVNAVAPGSIKTEWIKKWAISHEDLEDISQSIPLKRLGDTTEVAQTVLFLASDMSTYVTGQIIGVDGGIF